MISPEKSVIQHTSLFDSFSIPQNQMHTFQDRIETFQEDEMVSIKKSTFDSFLKKIEKLEESIFKRNKKFAHRLKQKTTEIAQLQKENAML